MQNFGGLQSAFGPDAMAQASRQSYLRQRYPDFDLKKAEEWDADRRRPLTPSEIALARSVYASSIRYDQVSVFREKSYMGLPLKAPHAPNGNIYYPAGTGYMDDFGRASTIRARSVFIHELCHVWQHQRGIFLPLHVIMDMKPRLSSGPSGRRVHNNDNYVYAHMFRTSGWRRHFSSLDVEAQAEFMSDYYLVKHRQPASMEANRGFSRSDYEERLPAAMRSAGVGAPAV